MTTKSDAYILKSILARVNRMALGPITKRNRRGKWLFSWRKILFKEKKIYFHIHSGLSYRYENESLL